MLTGLAVAAAILMVGLRLTGNTPYAVLSGSMEPAYPVGALIYVRQTPPEDIRVGDVISFVLDEDLTVATHRVVERSADGTQFYTKGDANASPDGTPVDAGNILGVVQFHVPLLGYGAMWLHTGGGRWAVLAAAAGVLLLVLLRGCFRRVAQPKEKTVEFYPAAKSDKKYIISKGETK